MEAICNKLGGDEGIAKFLRGDLILTERLNIPEPEPVLDFLITVNRIQKPSYPEWVTRVVHPEFELSGPAKFDLRNDVSFWIHEYQKIGSTTGSNIYTQLSNDNLLKDCLNLADLITIREILREKGIEGFRNFCKGKAVFGWKSVVDDDNYYRRVPFLIENDSKVVLDWYWVGNYWPSNFPALLFSK